MGSCFFGVVETEGLDSAITLLDATKSYILVQCPASARKIG